MTGLRLLAVPQPNAPMHNLDLQPLPVRGCQRLDPFVHPLSTRSGLQTAARSPAAPSITRCHLRLGILHMNTPILVHIHHEYSAHGIQAPQEGRLFSIAPIGTYPRKSHPRFALAADHLQSQFHLAATTPFLLRYARLSPTPWVVHPLFGRIQPQICQGRQMALAQGPENTDSENILLLFKKLCDHLI